MFWERFHQRPFCKTGKKVNSLSSNVFVMEGGGVGAALGWQEGVSGYRFWQLRGNCHDFERMAELKVS